MAHYTRQKDSDLEVEELRGRSPSSEILSETGGGAVSFISPGFRYQMSSTSVISGRTCLEKILAVLVIVVFIVCIILLVFTFSIKKETKINMYLSHLNQKNATTLSDYCMSPACVQVAAAIIQSADFSIDPCDDFYQYACGGWIEDNPIPFGKASWSTFSKLWQKNEYVMKGILESNATGEEVFCEPCKKARDYYLSCFDTNGTLDELGGQPLLELLQKFYWNITDFDGAGQLDSFNLQDILHEVQHKYNVGGLFVWNVGEDDKNSSVHVLQIDQGGLSLGNREYYINKTDDDPILSALLEYMVDITTLLYKDKKNVSEVNTIIQGDIRQQMEDILSFEKQVAEISSPASQQRDEERRYHSFNVEQLQNISDFLSWEGFFQKAFDSADVHINSSQRIIVYSPDYMRNLSELITNMTTEERGRNTLNNYILWQLISGYKSALSREYREMDRVLRKALTGASNPEERWRQCVSDTDNVLGFALGAMFVNKTFDGDSKPEAEFMIKAITEAFISEIHKKDWIDNRTKEIAERKAKKIANMIGYPDYIMNNTRLDEKYAKLDIDQDYFGNNVRFNKFSLEENLSELGKPVKRDRWGMTPQTINAYYTPTKNQIVFPAGILQLPFFSLHNPKSLNYGAMGVVMGHELSHAFDDQGREYDEDGNMRGWWQNKTLLEYKMRVGCMEEQYGNYTVNGENVNGKQTVGENIADNGGLKTAYEAYQRWLERNPGAETGLLPGINLTHNQLFFLSFSQVWCSQSTPQSDHYSLIEDSHSPPRLRVLGTLANSEYFSDTFQCEQGRPMNPGKEARCSVW